jgi:hypothetical protein
MSRQRAQKVKLVLAALKRLHQRMLSARPVAATVQAAREALARRYAEMRRRLRGTGDYEQLSCVCKLDRVVFTTTTWPAITFNGIPGFRTQQRRSLWGSNQLYQFAQPFAGTGSVHQVVVQFGPKSAWVAPYRITVLPKDHSGLQPEDLKLIVGLFQDFKFVLLEIALDAPMNSIMDVDYVRRFGVSGKSWLPPGDNPLYDKWGTSRGLKVIRSYPKWEIAAHRLELELHSAFLRLHGINGISDFQRFAKILPRKHIFFAELDEAKLHKQLQVLGRKKQSIKNILAQVEERRTSLWTTLTYLRKRVHLTNVQRLLVPHEETNRVVRGAIEKWAAEWAKVSGRPREPK